MPHGCLCSSQLLQQMLRILQQLLLHAVTHCC
jgi:hypothetical protein